MATHDTPPRPESDEPPTHAEVTRRDFLVRAGVFGGAITLFSGTPSVLRGVVRESAHAMAGAAHGVAGPGFAAPGEDLSPLFSGLEWRMLGPFRGGRTDAVSGVPGRPNDFYSGSVNGGLW
ncbi:MAG: twin-arginine translocation signal domain-containing protein, partial [Gemmatimonadaceae bacterium]